MAYVISGGNESLRIDEAMARLLDDGLEARHVLITVVDSDSRPALFLVPLLDSEERGYRVLGDQVLVGIETYTWLDDEQRCFHGFDEIWLFHEPPTQPKPVEHLITSDRGLNLPVPGELEQWMVSEWCLLGLGDGTGCGLNVVTSRPDLVRLLVPTW